MCNETDVFICDVLKSVLTNKNVKKKNKIKKKFQKSLDCKYCTEMERVIYLLILFSFTLTYIRHWTPCTNLFIHMKFLG